LDGGPKTVDCAGELRKKKGEVVLSRADEPYLLGKKKFVLKVRRLGLKEATTLWELGSVGG